MEVFTHVRPRGVYDRNGVLWLPIRGFSRKVEPQRIGVVNYIRFVHHVAAQPNLQYTSIIAVLAIEPNLCNLNLK